MLRILARSQRIICSGQQLNFATKALTADTLNPRVVAAEYAVRGAIVLRALEHQKALDNGEPRPFDQIVYCNIGNPQQLGQKPISFNREVLALCNAPDLIKDSNVTKLFSKDAVERATQYIDAIDGGIGAYSQSNGIEIVREEIAKFIEERDGYPSSPDSIFVTDGASPAVQMLLQLLIRDSSDGVMIPIPQYPLYSATITLCGGTQVPYYLDESRGWGMDVAELERALGEARAKGINTRALAVINPGNPTGQCLSADNMAAVAEFCARQGLLLMADEVYQENIWQSQKPFRSFKAVLRDLGPQHAAADLQLASFHSVSKGFLGECGRRGGYVEFTGVCEDVKEQFYKLASVNLCSNTTGQVMMGLMVNPPVAGQACYPQYASEREELLASMGRRAAMISRCLNKMEGVSANPTEGAMYTFPSITLPAAAVAAAAERGVAPDAYYCMELLDAAGVVVVPGSGFGQRDGTWHFRSTILPLEEDIQGVVDKMAAFHDKFMADHR